MWRFSCPEAAPCCARSPRPEHPGSLWRLTASPPLLSAAAASPPRTTQAPISDCCCSGPRVYRPQPILPVVGSSPLGASPGNQTLVSGFSALPPSPYVTSDVYCSLPGCAPAPLVPSPRPGPAPWPGQAGEDAAATTVLSPVLGGGCWEGAEELVRGWAGMASPPGGEEQALRQQVTALETALETCREQLERAHCRLRRTERLYHDARESGEELRRQVGPGTRLPPTLSLPDPLSPPRAQPRQASPQPSPHTHAEDPPFRLSELMGQWEPCLLEPAWLSGPAGLHPPGKVALLLLTTGVCCPESASEVWLDRWWW